jgi:hypothetical protein
MKSSPQFMVAKQLQELVVKQMPPGVNDQHVQRYVQYFMRILSSRIQTTAGPADADHIKSLLQNKSKSFHNNPRSKLESRRASRLP